MTYTKKEKAPEEIGEDGEKYKYTYTNIIVDDKDPGRKEIGAHSVEAALYYFMRPANSPGLNQHPDYLEGFYPYQEQIDALKIWNEHIDVARTHVLPPLSFTDKESLTLSTVSKNLSLCFIKKNPNNNTTITKK